MLTRLREVEGGYKVTLFTADGEADSRETASLTEGFAWRAYASEHGALPPIVTPHLDTPLKPKKGKK